MHTSKPGVKNQTSQINKNSEELVTIHDKEGNILQKIMHPLMLKFHPRDVMQILTGAVILAIPVGLTEETWKLGETLPLANVLMLSLLSLLFLATFIYYNYYRGHMRHHWFEFVKRTISTYLLSLFVVAIILTIIEKAPWDINTLLAVKRTIIVALPASLSAAVVDIIK